MSQDDSIKITYLASIASIDRTGPFKKILGQCKHWIKNGNSVCLILILYGNVTLEKLCEKIDLPDDLDVEVIRVADYRSKIKVWKNAFRLVAETKPDLHYLRTSAYFPGLRAVGKKVPVVIEVNSNPFTEQASFIKSVYQKGANFALCGAVRGAVFVTNELAELKEYKSIKQRLVLRNSIDIDVEFSRSDRPEKAAVFVGDLKQPWQGFDKIQALAKRLSDWKIHIVGPKLESVEPNIVFHGVQHHDYYKTLFQNCAFGIGPLALHRKQMNEACALKVTEYFAHRLPVLIGYTETGFENGKDYLLSLPNVESNIESSFERISKFAEDCLSPKHNWDGIDEMILTKNVEAKRLKFFVAVVEANRNYGDSVK